MSNFSVFLFWLFSYSPLWQLQIIFKFCGQHVCEFSWSSYSDEFLTVLLNNCKRYSSFVIILMINSVASHVYSMKLWNNVWKNLDYVICACILFMYSYSFCLFLKSYVITYKKGFSKILSFWLTPFSLWTIIFSDGPTLQM